MQSSDPVEFPDPNSFNAIIGLKIFFYLSMVWNEFGKCDSDSQFVCSIWASQVIEYFGAKSINQYIWIRSWKYYITLSCIDSSACIITTLKILTYLFVCVARSVFTLLSHWCENFFATVHFRVLPLDSVTPNLHDFILYLLSCFTINYFSSALHNSDPG